MKKRILLRSLKQISQFLTQIQLNFLEHLQLHIGSQVEKINSSSAYVVRNWNPVVRTELNPGGKNVWVTGDNKAAVTGSFFYRIGPLKDFAVQLGNVHLKAVGDKMERGLTKNQA